MFSSLTLCLILTLKENVGKNEKRKTKQLKAQHPTTDKLEQIPTSEDGGGAERFLNRIRPMSTNEKRQ